jgi:hypothetical protein
VNCWSVGYVDADIRSMKDVNSLDSHSCEALSSLQPHLSVLGIPLLIFSLFDFLCVLGLAYQSCAICCAEVDTLKLNDYGWRICSFFNSFSIIISLSIYIEI